MSFEIVNNITDRVKNADMDSADLDETRHAVQHTCAESRPRSNPAGIFRSIHCFLQRILTPVITAHFRGLDMYQVVVPMTTSSCLTTKPNFL